MVGAATIKVVTPDGAAVEGVVYTVTQLNQQAAKVLEEINESGVPALITKRGRFVAMVTPLASARVEAVALSQGPVAQVLTGPEWSDGGGGDDVLLSPDEVRHSLPRR